MPHWSDPLVAFLATQPPDSSTVTLTLAELAELAAGPLPAGAATRAYWWRSRGAPRRRLAAIGWRVAHVDRSAEMLTFEWVGRSA